MPDVRMYCLRCRVKWFFSEVHQARSDLDMTRCEHCGGPLALLADGYRGPAPDEGGDPRRGSP